MPSQLHNMLYYILQITRQIPPKLLLIFKQMISRLRTILCKITKYNATIKQVCLYDELYYLYNNTLIRCEDTAICNINNSIYKFVLDDTTLKNISIYHGNKLIGNFIPDERVFGIKYGSNLVCTHEHNICTYDVDIDKCVFNKAHILFPGGRVLYADSNYIITYYQYKLSIRNNKLEKIKDIDTRGNINYVAMVNDVLSYQSKGIWYKM